MNADTFNVAISTIPYNPHSETAKGLLAPILRASGHILYLLGAIASAAPTGTLTIAILTPEEEQRELEHAAAHLTPAALPNLDTLSATAKTHILDFIDGVAFARTSFSEWTHDERIECLRNLSNRAAGLAAFLDTELAGTDPNASDPGTSL